MKLSPENRALIERECGEKLFTDGFEQQGARFYPENLNSLLDAAREEGSTDVARLVVALTTIANMGYAGAPDIEMRRIARAALSGE